MSLSGNILTEVADQVGTPAFVYDAAELRAGVKRLKFLFPNVDFLYSLKANPNVSVVKTVTSQGIGAEVCSLYEIETSLAVGVPPEDTILVGPAKSELEIERAIALGFKAIVAESLQELEKISIAAADQEVIQRVALRINPSFCIPGARLTMSGRPTQFGIDEAEISDAIETVGCNRNLRLTGLHVYMGTRILDENVIIQNSRDILRLAKHVIELTGQELDFVDIGGGFGVAYAAHETDLDLERLGKTITQLVAEAKSHAPNTRIVIELGRYLVAFAGCFLTRVRYTKQSKGKRFAVCDGGSNCHLAAGQAAMFRNNFPITRIGTKSGRPVSWSITGPLCTPTDIIATDLHIQNLKAGDLIRIDRSGAYGPTASPVSFLSFGMPVEVMVDGMEVSVIRERSSLAELLASQVPRSLGSSQKQTVQEEVI